MEQYIPKSALVAEIERRRNICKKVVLDLRTEENKDYYQGKAEAYKEALDFLDTLEVKEVDLDSNTLEDNVVIKTDWEGDDWGVLIKKSNKAQKGKEV